MHYEVFLTEDTHQDLVDLYQYIQAQDSRKKALYVLDNFEKKFDSLSLHPERGVFPQELLALGIKEYREIFFKPYRIIYRITYTKVYITLIADGRRNMQRLLQRRILNP
jgi:toxin ParE1/3/4